MLALQMKNATQFMLKDGLVVPNKQCSGLLNAMVMEL